MKWILWEITFYKYITFDVHLHWNEMPFYTIIYVSISQAELLADSDGDDNEWQQGIHDCIRSFRNYANWTKHRSV